MGKAKRRKHSEEECRPSKKCRQQNGEGEEEGWSKTTRREVKTRLPQPVELLYAEDRHKRKRARKHKLKHKHKHKHKSRQRPECGDNGAKEPSQVPEIDRHETMCASEVEWRQSGEVEQGGSEGVEQRGSEEVEQGGSGEVEQRGDLMHKKHRTKHKKKPHKHVMVSEMEEPVADPLWADLCVQGDTNTGDEDDEFSVLHGRWLHTQEEEQRLWEEVGGWKRGKWSVQEVRRLKRNVKAFMKEYNVKDLGAFIFDNPTHQHYDLYHYIAKNIKRPLFPIYRKMLRVFDLTNHVGRWSKDQEKELLRLHELLGNRWCEVGRSLGVSGQAALDKYRSIHKRKNKGGWSVEEEQRLVEAMKHYRSGEEGDEDLPLHSVTWQSVAEKVGTRNADQCRRKWVYHLSWKEKGGRIQWTLQDDLALLQRLAAKEVEDEEEVEWGEMCEGWDSARSPYYLRMKWSMLRRDVPNYRLRTFQENLEYLLTYRVPVLERQRDGVEHTSRHDHS